MKAIGFAAGTIVLMIAAWVIYEMNSSSVTPTLEGPQQKIINTALTNRKTLKNVSSVSVKPTVQGKAQKNPLNTSLTTEKSEINVTSVSVKPTVQGEQQELPNTTLTTKKPEMNVTSVSVKPTVQGEQQKLPNTTTTTKKPAMNVTSVKPTVQGQQQKLPNTTLTTKKPDMNVTSVSVKPTVQGEQQKLPNTTMTTKKPAVNVTSVSVKPTVNGQQQKLPNTTLTTKKPALNVTSVSVLLQKLPNTTKTTKKPMNKLLKTLTTKKPRISVVKPELFTELQLAKYYVWIYSNTNVSIIINPQDLNLEVLEVNLVSEHRGKKLLTLRFSMTNQTAKLITDTHVSPLPLIQNEMTWPYRLGVNYKIVIQKNGNYWTVNFSNKLVLCFTLEKRQVISQVEVSGRIVTIRKVEVFRDV